MDLPVKKVIEGGGGVWEEVLRAAYRDKGAISRGAKIEPRMDDLAGSKTGETTMLLDMDSHRAW